MFPRSSDFNVAFTATTFAIICLAAGLSGYNMSKHARFVAGTAWSDTFIWWEVALGVAVLPIAVFYIRRADRSVPQK